MITPIEFLKRWNVVEYGRLINYRPKSLVNLKIDNASKEFLIRAGLPEASAPFLEFEPVRGSSIPTVSEKLGLSNEFNIYKCIGSKGLGDPVCINERNGTVVYLNHYNGFKEVFINSSIPLLAESLLFFAEFVEESIKENGSWAFISNNIPNRLKVWIENELERIDTEAVKGGSFWGMELFHLKNP